MSLSILSARVPQDAVAVSPQATAPASYLFLGLAGALGFQAGFGLHIFASTDFNQPFSIARSSAALSGIFFDRSVFSPMSASRSYSST
jgi:hypothetical protein